eukprot:CAMPEP_0184298486 /NCGR_PEP_ID=MMETSP1049-20130417/9285_1 /TAXON_ID=77928 /ORGANISM="Proteomonas sulcata, Strain CCMP704" /LENGTH=44 /DNA_ID= /DNA_START= /DNA_END= /DNA_ORIENTATION=
MKQQLLNHVHLAGSCGLRERQDLEAELVPAATFFRILGVWWLQA